MICWTLPEAPVRILEMMPVQIASNAWSISYWRVTRKKHPMMTTIAMAPVDATTKAAKRNTILSSVFGGRSPVSHRSMVHLISFTTKPLRVR